MAIPDPLKAVKQIYRTLKPGGTAAITTWKHMGYMVIFHDAQRKVKPDSKLLPGPRGIAEEWMGDTKFRSTLEAAGFQTKNIEITTETAITSSDMWGKGLESEGCDRQRCCAGMDGQRKRRVQCCTEGANRAGECESTAN